MRCNQRDVQVTNGSFYVKLTVSQSYLREISGRLKEVQPDEDACITTWY